MKRFFFLFALLLLGGVARVEAQAVLMNLGEHRETYAMTEHVPADAWEKPAPAVEAKISQESVIDVSRFTKADHLEMAVFPNPTRSEASFRISIPSQEAVRLDLVDARGQLLRTVYENAFQSEGILEQKLGLMGYPAGVYYLRVRIGEEMHSLPVVKQ